MMGQILRLSLECEQLYTLQRHQYSVALFLLCATVQLQRNVNCIYPFKFHSSQVFTAQSSWRERNHEPQVAQRHFR
jgi:hypothetical protein